MVIIIFGVIALNIKITEHAILRRYERFHFLENISKDQLKNNILEDLKEYIIIKPLNKKRNINLIKGIAGYYITQNTKSKIEIITTFKDLYTKIKNTDFNFQTKLNLPEEELSFILTILQNDDAIFISQAGSKKLIVVDKLLLLIRDEMINNKQNIIVLDKYYLSEFYNIDRINEIKLKLFNNFNDKAWDIFSNILNLNEFIYNYQKYKLDEINYEIKIYNQVLDGTLNAFPKYFWQDDIGGNKFEAANICTKYLFDEILQWNKYDICSRTTYEVFRANKLDGMLQILFQGSISQAINNAYSNIKPWELKKIKCINYFAKDDKNFTRSKDAIIWLLNELSKDGYIINQKNLLQFDWLLLLKKYRMHYMLNKPFNGFKNFFKECFDVEFEDIEIIRYETFFELNKGGYICLKR